MGVVGHLATAGIAILGCVAGLVLGSWLMVFGGACMLVGIAAVAWGESRHD